jgi:hypothetical protein
LKEAHRRIQWLQDEIHRGWGIDCASLPTGTSLQTQSRQETVGRNLAQPDCVPISPSGSVPAGGSSAHAPSETLVVNDAPEASLLALNASGELRYLGASSGTFFASCAAALVRSSAANRQSRTHAPTETARGAATTFRPTLAAPISMGQDEIQLLLKSYEMWVHPLYPLFDSGTLRDLVNRYTDRLSNTSLVPSTLTVDQNIEMTIVYVVMALGATNRSNTIKQLRLDRHSIAGRVGSAPAPSPASLCTISLKHLDNCLEDLQSNVQYIRMLLLFCIYSSYGPVGPSQWQLAGLAIRVGLAISSSSSSETGLKYSRCPDGGRDWSTPRPKALVCLRPTSRPAKARLLDRLRHRSHAGVQSWSASFNQLRAYNYSATDPD